MNKKLLLFITLLSLLLVLFLIRIFTVPTQQQSEPQPSTSSFPSFSQTQRGVGIETEEYKQAEREYIEQRPTLQKLPAENPFFEIEYRSETHLVVIATTEDKERDYREATAWFAANNIDTTNVLIDYR